jgi:hypothetical protein
MKWCSSQGFTMSLEDQIDYHSQRAMRELDLGLIASCVAAARAHLQLSSLHMSRMRELRGTSLGMRPPLVMG